MPESLSLIHHFPVLSTPKKPCDNICHFVHHTWVEKRAGDPARSQLQHPRSRARPCPPMFAALTCRGGRELYGPTGRVSWSRDHLPGEHNPRPSSKPRPLPSKLRDPHGATSSPTTSQHIFLELIVVYQSTHAGWEAINRRIRAKLRRQDSLPLKLSKFTSQALGFFSFPPSSSSNKSKSTSPWHASNDEQWQRRVVPSNRVMFLPDIGVVDVLPVEFNHPPTQTDSFRNPVHDRCRPGPCPRVSPSSP